MYERDSYNKVVESGEECNKGGGTGSVAQEIIAARQEKEREKGRQGGQVTQKEENIEQRHVEI